jgi:tetratricopeptide (TPR) repeat protein
MNIAPVAFLFLSLSGQNTNQVQTGAISQTQQAQSRDCAVNVAAVTGNVIVTCPGIPPKALEGLSRELKARRISEAQARREAEEYRQKYEGLESVLASAGLSEQLEQKALSNLQEGDLPGAAKALDEALKQRDQQVSRAADAHYYRAKVAELSFDSKTQGENLEAAYRLAPHSVVVDTDYGLYLIKYGKPAKAEEVLKSLLDEATVGKNVEMQAASLINLGSSLQFQRKFVEAKEAYLRAAILWDAGYKRHVHNALNNEADALLGAANIGLLQAHFEEAENLFSRAIELEKQALSEETDISNAQSYRLLLARAEEGHGDAYLSMGKLEEAYASYENAAETAKASTSDKLRYSARSSLGGALTQECLVLALQGHTEAALARCEDANAILGPLEDTEGGMHNHQVASSLFRLGTVQEDLKLYGAALTNFTKASAIWARLVSAGQPIFLEMQATAVWLQIGAAYNSKDYATALASARSAVQLSDEFPSALGDLHRAILTDAVKILEGYGTHEEFLAAAEKRDALGAAQKQ